MKEYPGVFISHSSQNIEIVQHFCTAIKAMGVEGDSIFCSSIPGQGVNNGQKLNDTIFNSINECDLLVYFISYDFINSPYCIEELGIGWYRSQKKESDCFYLLVPDISFSEIGGFVNSQIDKFTVIDDDHKDDFGLLLENICEKLELAMPKHSAFLNIEKVFFDSVRMPIEAACKSREENKHDEEKMLTRESVLYKEKMALEEKLAASNKQLIQEREKQKNDALRIEFQTIKNRFVYLGYGGGITKAEYDSLYKEFLLSMAARYVDLEKIFKEEDPDMEMLLACIYSHEGKPDVAYQHLVNYISYESGIIYPRDLKNVEIDRKNDMHEIISILEHKAQKERPGVTLDAYNETITALKERAKQSKRRGKTNA